MNFRHINIIRHEWKGIFRDINSILLLCLMPLVIVTQAFFVVFLIIKTADADILQNPYVLQSIERLINAIPAGRGLALNDRFILLFVSLLPIYFNIIPGVSAVSLASMSVVEEKMSGTIEPLLATPVRTNEIIIGKAIAHLLPTLISSYISFGLFLLFAYLFDWFRIVTIIPLYYWIISLFVLIPLSASLSFLMGISASSWAKNAKSAQNISLLFILPVMGLTAAQFLGIISMSIFTLTILSIILLLFNMLAIKIAINVFDRENIITNWRS